jgi:hypothetical protein
LKINGKEIKEESFIQSLLWNKGKDRKCGTTICNMYFKKILLHEAQTWTCAKREGSKLQADVNGIPEVNSGKNQEIQN